ncbi:murein biosynthesis integral membrane protein MurJ [Hydrogenispora sp. UU3]|uniref:Lipid II flippase n=1 Tax=Capillibacterium thermochitinicola TaxID=2699427 RepID=A0A8J6I033_9FIRM|nr:murein biosynthesis integral membrane protein MurJ [Capillibacterium thermochitinicola]MBA2133125.1 murein biosynthesis integral membrane protein MurJ [Capillibacterium thermochitinicola]
MPRLLFRTLCTIFWWGGALSAAFIPLFSEYLAKGEETEGWKMASTFLNVTIILLACFSLLGMVFARQLAPLQAYQMKEGKLELLVELTRMMFPAVFFTALAGLMGGVLNSYQRFFIPAFGPILYNVGIILGAWFLGPRFGIKGMAFGVVAGAITNFLTQAFAVKKISGYNPFYINLQHPGYKKMIRLMVPAILGLSATQLNIWVTTNMASALPEGSITYLRLAQRLVLLPLGIFASAVSTAFFPTLSQLTAVGKWTEFKENLILGIRVILFITIPSAFGFISMRTEIIRLLYERGEFTPLQSELTAYALFFYSLGLFAHGVIQILPRGFYALKDTVTPVKVSLVTVLLSIGLNFLFLKYTPLQHGGLALSFSLMGVANMLLSFFLLRRKVGGLRSGKLIKTGLQSILAGLGMSVVIRLFLPFWNRFLAGMGLTVNLFRLLQVMGGIGIGVIFYLALAAVLRMEEVKLIEKIIRKNG